MSLKGKNTALIIIDVQKAFVDEEYWGGNRNNPTAEENIVEILKAFRSLDQPIFHVLHASQNPNSPLHSSAEGFQMIEMIQPLKHEPVIIKNVNSAFIGTDLKQQLETLNITRLVIVGLTTNHCVSTTTRMAGNYGFETYLIADATATFDRKGINGQHFDAETVHQVTLASLNDEFANVMNTNDLIKALNA